MKPTPLVSVAIPTYNQPALLLEALQSVFAQTFEDYEVIVVNDGSTDDTAQRLAPLVERHQNLRVVTQPNGGIGAARNRAIDEARGKYVALLDHDDLWRPEKLATQARFMQEHPQCAACSVPWSFSTDVNRCFFDRASVCSASGIVERPMLWLSRCQVFLISSAILFDRERAAGLRYETMRRCIEDTAFQLGLFGRGAFGVAGEEILMVYRAHPGNYSRQADFSYNGLWMLRRMRREGRFKDFDVVGQRDLTQFLAWVGRWAAVTQLLAGLRARAGLTYSLEFFHQARERRLRFLGTFPMLLFAPQSLLRRRWPPETLPGTP